ncbi:MAG: cysteine synthase [Oligoflexia bacterium]|nr:cysteine synthase [Oligoflexia bacterium]
MTNFSNSTGVKKPLVAKNITELIGNTPLVKINKLPPGIRCSIYAKLEYFNPGFSVKDRIALNMIVDAERRGILTPGKTIIEPTSGNTGIGLAMICASKGYPLILVMPESMSIERRKVLLHFGARFVLTPGEQGMRGAISRVQAMLKNSSELVFLGQFTNPANTEIHRLTTAEEIWQAFHGAPQEQVYVNGDLWSEDGVFEENFGPHEVSSIGIRDSEEELMPQSDTIDILVAGVGTGGTISGVGSILKRRNEKIKIFAVEPSESPVLSGGSAGAHNIQGIGAGFVPEILQRDMIDEVLTVSSGEAILHSRKLALEEGILCGISSGAAYCAALEVARRREFQGKNMVVIFPDLGERYISTELFSIN